MGRGYGCRVLNDTKVQVRLLYPRVVFWDFLVGLSLVSGFALLALAYKEINQMRKELEDLKSMIRVIRFNALESQKKGE